MKYLRTVPTNTEVYDYAQFMTLREKQILARVIGIQKKWGVTRHFFLEIIKQQ